MAMGRSAVALTGSLSPHSLAAVAKAMASRTARSTPRSSSGAGVPSANCSLRRRAGEKNRSAAIPGEESRPISLRPAPQRLGTYGKIVRSRSQHTSGERQHLRVSAMDPIMVVQRTGAPAGRQGQSLPEQTLWRRRITHLSAGAVATRARSAADGAGAPETGRVTRHAPLIQAGR